MARLRIIFSVVILIVALFLVFDRLFTPQTIQITLESGQEITTTTPEYFTFIDALMLVISAFLVGATATYLFYNSDTIKMNSATTKNNNLFEDNKKDYSSILPLLKPDEKKVISELQKAHGQMQQSKIAATLNLSKVKITRILYKLATKELIIKERHGFTNIVKLKK